MNDWKSTLRKIKKEITTKSGAGEQRKDATKTNPEYSIKQHPPARKLGDVVVHVRDANRPTHPRVHDNLRHPSGMLPSAGAIAPASTINQNAALVNSYPPKPMGVPQLFQKQLRKGLTRQSYFKLPDAWVSSGLRTQASLTQKGNPIDICIGLDFGTSFTKAAVGLKDQVFVVSWHGLSAYPDQHLLPSEFSLLANGSYQIGQAPEVSYDQVHQRLKHPLIDPAVSSTSLARAAIFVALVLRYIRAWIYLHHANKIGASPIRWLLNIGAPSNGLENERLERAYRKMGETAWGMSLDESDIRPDNVKEKILTWQPDALPKDLIGLHILPEFVAQIAGYVQSSQRQRGLHSLIDVGGGTLDVVTFIVHESDGEDVFPFLVPEIKILGTQMLNYNRLVDAPDQDEDRLPDELQPILSAEEFAQVSGLSEKHVRERDELLWSEIQNLVHRVLHKTKRTRYRLSEAWEKGLPVFLTGGGGVIDGYRRSICDGGGNVAPIMNILSLPIHPRLADFTGDKADYQRISVACGLAQDAFSLGRLVPAGKVEDDVPVKTVAVERPSHDELYSR